MKVELLPLITKGDDWINSYKHFGMDMNGANREGIKFNIIGTNYKLTNIQEAATWRKY